MSYRRLTACAWWGCGKVFLAHTTGKYCSKTCKKMAYREGANDGR